MRETDRGSTVDWLLIGADGQEIRLVFPPGGYLTVGRDLSSDIALHDAGVSRRHARIRREEGTLWVEDLHSQNGTFVNTRAIRKAEVHEGDIVTFGRLHCTLLGRRCSDDPGPSLLRPLSTEALGRLLELARNLNAHRDPWVAFRKSLEPLVRALGAARGAILAWDASREDLHTVAAHPSSSIHELDFVATDPLASTVLRSGSARGSHGTFPARGGRLSMSQVMVPIFSHRRPHGLIYLARHEGSPPFSRAERDFLNAFAWLSEGAFEDLVAAGAESRKETAGPLQSPPSPRPEATRDRGERRVPDRARYLAYLAKGLGHARAGLAPILAAEPEVAELRRLQLLAEALELLEGAAFEEPSRVSLDALLEEAATAYAVAGERWRLVSTGPLLITVPRVTLRIAFGLVGAALDRGQERRRCPSSDLEVRAVSQGPRLELGFRTSAETTGVQADEVLLEIASEVLASRLEGGFEPIGGEIVVRLPVAREHFQSPEAGGERTGGVMGHPGAELRAGFRSEGRR